MSWKSEISWQLFCLTRDILMNVEPWILMHDMSETETEWSKDTFIVTTGNKSNSDSGYCFIYRSSSFPPHFVTFTKSRIFKILFKKQRLKKIKSFMEILFQLPPPPLILILDIINNTQGHKNKHRSVNAPSDGIDQLSAVLTIRRCPGPLQSFSPPLPTFPGSSGHGLCWRDLQSQSLLTHQIPT